MTRYINSFRVRLCPVYSDDARVIRRFPYRKDGSSNIRLPVYPAKSFVLRTLFSRLLTEYSCLDQGGQDGQLKVK